MTVPPCLAGRSRRPDLVEPSAGTGETALGALATVVVMTTVLLFHHAPGQTPGFLAFIDELREAGHTIQAPDLYEGKTFGTVDEGVANAKRFGFSEIIRRGSEAAQGLPADIVYAGFSLGVMPAQSLTQTRPGARGALLLPGTFPLEEFGGQWPLGLPLQIH